MKSNYNKIGQYIRLIDERNFDLKVETLLGLTINKDFIPSVANTVGSDMSRYKIIRKNQFACSLMQVRRDKKIPVALQRNYKEAIISQAYPVFDVTNKDELLPEYLMMWFSRSEFDREACFYAVGGVRGSLEWEDFCNMQLPVPDIEKQKAIVKEYNTIANRIKLNEQLNQKLEETAQAIYKKWFVDFEFPMTKEYAESIGKPELEGKAYKANGGKMVWNEELGEEIPVGWENKKIEEISILKYGKMLDSSLFKSTGYPVFSGYGIRGYYSEYMYKEAQILVLCRGVSGTGRVEISPPKSYITNLSIIVEIDEKSNSKYFFYLYLKNDNLRTLDSGSAQSQITTGDLGYRSVIRPLLNIQNSFGIKVEIILNQQRILNEQRSELSNFSNLVLSKMATINN